MILVAACKKYFGQKPGQSLMEFSAELKELTDKDRTELKEMLTKEFGEEIK